MAQFPKEQDEEGGFQRQEDAFRHFVTSGEGGEFPAEAGRYHLYISLACPWAHRTLIVRHLLGLEDVITVTVADPVRDERGWAFREGEGHSGDEVNGFQFLAQAYQASDRDFSGRVTVPVLWDRHKKTIVNNSEDDICQMFAQAFRQFHTRECDLFPAALQDRQTALSTFIYEKVNNGVYKAGFATTQIGYAKAAGEVFNALDELENRLSNRRFLLGDTFVETDWRLFCTLIRFDAVYHGHFKCNLRQIRDYGHLSTYLRRLYHQPGIAETVSFDHIKRHYYMTHEDINPTRIVPVGPDLSWLEKPVL
ncbi:glutathione S-transferase C-terminal domain-containing protein [Prosthecobacter sp. SYSU 5D2]|uniref:glutathione S-transferase family protein n=1 Tax=Prosthecobacter sp. SYSU 5D2 TaxID=3134134 RepID=UPI0031FEEC4A